LEFHPDLEIPMKLTHALLAVASLLATRSVAAPAWFDLTVRDVPRAEAFYADVLGWTFATEPDAYVLVFESGRPVGGLYHLDGAAGVGGASVYFHTPDVDHQNVERARIVAMLRAMLFSVESIQELLSAHDDDGDAVAFFERHRAVLDGKIRAMQAARATLDRIVAVERRAASLLAVVWFEVEEKVLPPVLVAGVRMRGRYDEIGGAFATLGRAFGRGLAGNAGTAIGLFYDADYRETDADFEGCLPLRAAPRRAVAGIGIRELPGGRAVTMMYQGPYEQIGRAYARLFAWVQERGVRAALPTRQVYVKGPGMIFKGRAKSYLTEIQLLI
jgi:effector-binding domain-containing protein